MPNTQHLIKNKYVVGLTGGIGSGKSTASLHFADLGIDIIDADDISRSLLTPGSPALKKVVTFFGKEILGDNKELNRPLLRKIIFSNKDAKKFLEQLLHPLIRKKIDQMINQSTSDYAILSAPLLLENKQFQFVNRVLVIDTPRETQISRTLLRDKNTQSEIEKIISSQISRKQRLQLADDIITNSSDLSYLKQSVKELHEFYQQESQRNKTG